MFLREVFDLIGYSKLQQIILIKILFLTGSLGFVEPTSLEDIKEVVRINEEYLSSEIGETLLFEKHNKSLSNEKAAEILAVAEFGSKEQAYHWLDSLLQRKFALPGKERIEINDAYKNSAELQNLLIKFMSPPKNNFKSHFDSIIILPGIESKLRERILYVRKMLENSSISVPTIYINYSHRKGFPYEESFVEESLARKVSEKNKKSFEYNLKSVRAVFVEVAKEYLYSYAQDNNITLPSQLKEIKIFFKNNPDLYDIKKLTLLLSSQFLLKDIEWPTEKDAVEKYMKEYFKFQKISAVEVFNRKINQRADTIDNALYWLKSKGNDLLLSNPNPKILLVTDQAPSRYVLASFKSILPESFNIEVLTPESAEKQQNASLRLNYIAREVHVLKNLILGKK